MEIFIKVLHGQDIYKSIEEKGANFLYLIVKNHVFADGNKRLAITLSTLFLLLNGYMSIAATFLQKTENISLNVAASKIDKELLHKIMEAIMNETFDTDEELKLEIYNAIN